MAEDSKLKVVGSLWTHKDKTGKIFLSGNLDLTALPFEQESVNIFVFNNKFWQKGTKKPNLRVFISVPDTKSDNPNNEPEPFA